jgi:succinate dehydrogenase (ubiquinone) cytochrome b560 subunit
MAAKFAIAFSFTFHAINGVGHLIWDTGRRFSTTAIVRQGWTIVGTSLLAAGYLALM